MMRHACLGISTWNRRLLSACLARSGALHMRVVVSIGPAAQHARAAVSYASGNFRARFAGGPNELSDAHAGLVVEISLPKQEWTKYQDDNERLWFWNEEDGRSVVPGRHDCTWIQYVDDAGRRWWLHDAGKGWFWEP